MKKIFNIIRWIGVGVFGIMALSSLVQGGIIGTLLFLLGGAIITPLSVISKIRNKLKLNKVVSIILAVVLLFVGALFIPTSDVSDNINKGTQISGTNSGDKLNTETTSNNASVSSDTATENKTTESISNSTNAEEPKENEPQTTVCNHSKITVKNKLNATCSEKGYTGDTYCESCDKKIQNGSEIPTTDHDTEIRNKKNATESSEGYTGDTYCKICDTKIKSGQSIPKIVNKEQDASNSKTVYVTETGKKYHSRSNCSGLSRAKKIYTSTLQGAKNRGLGPCSICY